MWRRRVACRETWQRVWRNRATNTYHVEYGYSCMGYEVSAALGVKLAQPQSEVYSLVGDGSFMMLHSELVTSLQERAKINIVLLDNMANGCINNLQMEHGMDSFGTEFRFRCAESGQLQGGPGAGRFRHRRCRLRLQNLARHDARRTAPRAGRRAPRNRQYPDRH